MQGLSQDFKNACPKQQFQNICPSLLSPWVSGVGHKEITPVSVCLVYETVASYTLISVSHQNPSSTPGCHIIAYLLAPVASPFVIPLSYYYCCCLGLL